MELHDPARSPAKDECRRQIIFQAYLSRKGKQKNPQSQRLCGFMVAGARFELTTFGL